MGKRAKSKLNMEGGPSLQAENPFAALDLDLPEAKPSPAEASPAPSPARPRFQGRLEVRRLKKGKGGKTVTEVKGFSGFAQSQMPAIRKDLQDLCATGGTHRADAIEIQGDHRDRICEALAAMGFRPVQAGG